MLRLFILFTLIVIGNVCMFLYTDTDVKWGLATELFGGLITYFVVCLSLIPERRLAKSLEFDLKTHVIEIFQFLLCSGAKDIHPKDRVASRVLSTLKENSEFQNLHTWEQELLMLHLIELKSKSSDCKNEKEGREMSSASILALTTEFIELICNEKNIAKIEKHKFITNAANWKYHKKIPSLKILISRIELISKNLELIKKYSRKPKEIQEIFVLIFSLRNSLIEVEQIIRDYLAEKRKTSIKPEKMLPYDALARSLTDILTLEFATTIQKISIYLILADNNLPQELKKLQ